MFANITGGQPRAADRRTRVRRIFERIIDEMRTIQRVRMEPTERKSKC